VFSDTGDKWFDVFIASTDAATNMLLTVTAAVIVVAGLATVNATATAVVERRRQLGLLRSLGATPAQIRRLVVIEVLAAGAVGTSLGLLVGAVLHRGMVRAVNNATPFPEDYSFSWPTVGQAVASAMVALLIGATIPAWQASRSRIADALAYE